MFNYKMDLNKIIDEKIKNEKQNDNPSFAERMADKVAEFGGSWKFIFFSITFFICWIIFNLYFTRFIFDAYPFILLNLFLSFFAILQAPFILMSQNRISDIYRRRDEREYRINLIEELEIRELIDKVDFLIKYIK